MRIRRTVLKDGTRNQYFHVVSRVVDRRLIFGEDEKARFYSLLRRFEGFSGVQVISYCLMGNHFHLLLHIPPRPEHIPDEEVRRRMQHIYSSKRIAEFDRVIEDRLEAGDAAFEVRFYDEMRQRMYDLSSFVKDIKLRFSKWYNAVQERTGTLWEERFRCSLLEGNGNILKRVAAYIELNPIRAGIADSLDQYAWSSYSEAVQGGKQAQSGIKHIVTPVGPQSDWNHSLKVYREFLTFVSHSQKHKKRGVTENPDSIPEISSTDEDAGNQQGLSFLSSGFVWGSVGFVEEFVNCMSDHLGIRARVSALRRAVPDNENEISPG